MQDDIKNEFSWEFVHINSSFSLPSLWGIHFVCQNNIDNQFFVFDPSCKKQWMITLKGNIGYWNSYDYSSETNPCIYNHVECFFPFNIINNNRNNIPRKHSGLVRGRRNNRTIITQRFKPLKQILSTNGRGECIFSYGSVFFYIDSIIPIPIVRRLQITNSRNIIKRNYSSNNEISIRRKWATYSTFNQILFYYGGIIVNIKTKNYTTTKNTLQFPRSSLLLYDFASDDWIKHSIISENRVLHTCTKIGNRLFIIGGINNQGICSSVLLFDIVNLNWINDIQCESLSIYGHTAIAYYTKIIVWGGLTYNGDNIEYINENILHIFDTVQLKWYSMNIINNIPARFGHESILLNNFMYIIGGISPSGDINQECHRINLLPTLDVYLDEELSIYNILNNLLQSHIYADLKIIINNKLYHLHSFILEYRAPELLNNIKSSNTLTSHKVFQSKHINLLCEQAFQLIYTDHCQVPLPINNDFKELLNHWNISRATIIDNSINNEDINQIKTPIEIDLYKILNNSNYYDIHFTFKDDNRILHSHKALLSSRSSYFKGLLSFEESNTIDITTETYESLQIILEFITTDSCNITTENVIELLQLADRYDLPRLKLMCSQVISDNLEDLTVITILENSFIFNCPQLTTISINFILKQMENNNSVYRLPSFNELSQSIVNLLKQYI